MTTSSAAMTTDQKGMTLVELIVSLALLSVAAVLGVKAYVAHVRFNNDTARQQRAVLALEDQAERLRARPAALHSGKSPMDPEVLSVHPLPQGRGQVEVTDHRTISGLKMVTITIWWKDTAAQMRSASVSTAVAVVGSK